jgi:RNA polymerase sigma-70 factor (ECF subfamily)
MERTASGVVPTDDHLARARAGDHDAFALLIEPRAGRLLTMARTILGNEADAYEAAQEALIAAWIQLPSLRDPERFDAWLNRTLVNKCRDALRKRRRTREIDLSGQALTVPDAAEGSATQAAVLAAFERLSISERHILALRHVQDLQLNEIAAQLGIPLGTAKSRLWSARRALERALEAEA